MVREGLGYCADHRRAKQQTVKAELQQADKVRGTAAQRGYGYRWQKLRAAYLASHQTCAECRRQGRLTIAVIVDHITPHKGDMALFWDPTNWQPLCKPCHDRKTATEDGGWGRGA